MAVRTRSRFDDVDTKPKNDAYTGLLALSLMAMLASCVVLYLDYAQYGTQKAPAPGVPAPKRAEPAINQGTPVNTTSVPSVVVPVAAVVAPPVSVAEPDTTAPAPLPANLDGPDLPKPVLPPN